MISLRLAFLGGVGKTVEANNTSLMFYKALHRGQLFQLSLSLASSFAPKVFLTPDSFIEYIMCYTQMTPRELSGLLVEEIQTSKRLKCHFLYWWGTFVLAVSQSSRIKFPDSSSSWQGPPYFYNM